MKNFSSLLYSILILIATMQYAHSDESWDSAADQEIRACISSDEFQNVTIQYFYNDETYNLLIIINPQNEKMYLYPDTPSMLQFHHGVITKDRIPDSLMNHLKDVVDDQLNDNWNGGSFWSFNSFLNGFPAAELFAHATVNPDSEKSESEQNVVFEQPKGIDEENIAADEMIRELFKETIFRKLSINYKWEGKKFQIHLMHNPLKKILFCSDLSGPVKWPFAMTIEPSSYSLSLVEHVKSLVPDELLNDPYSILDVAQWRPYIRKHSCSIYKKLQPLSDENANANQQISDLFFEQEFTKMSLNYEWDGKTYIVHLVYNPMKEPLYCYELEKPVYWSFAMTVEDSHPLALANYLKSLVPAELTKDSSSLIDVAGSPNWSRKRSYSVYKNLHPILVYKGIENPEIDAEIQAFFCSNKLSKKVVYYQLGRSFYSILLICNPEKMKLTSAFNYGTRQNGKPTHTVTWDKKIGIFADDEAPSELIDHLKRLNELSWWDNIWNLTIYNGDQVTGKREGSWEDIYRPFTWYKMMMNAEPK